jgi:hypothetical protein
VWARALAGRGGAGHLSGTVRRLFVDGYGCCFTHKQAALRRHQGRPAARPQRNL